MTNPADKDVPTLAARVQPQPPTQDAAATLPARPDARAPKLDQEGAQYSEPRVVRAPTDEPGSFIDRSERYRSGDLLGRGGMGTVRLFKDRRIGREVALKRIDSVVEPGGETWARFVREARVQGQLEHPAIVPVYDLDLSAEGDPYFTMRRVQGDTLAQLLARLAKGDAATRERWTQRRLLTAFVQVCLAVHYAHTKAVLHRDLKPGNIMLGAFGEVYVLDWGLARLLDEDEAPHKPAGSPVITESSFDLTLGSGGMLTEAGAVMGTPMYMAPEQFRGERDVDARLDVYALGMILYELFALKPLHHGRERQDLIVAVLCGVDARPSLVAPETPPEIDALCARATALEPADRVPTALELAECVERFLDGVRDTERRQELAGQAAARATATLHAADTARDEAAREQARARAMREVVSALALDAEQPEARSAMVQLLTHVPPVPPPAVQRELEDEQNGARRRGFKLARWAWVSWVLTIPMAYVLGIRSGLPVAIEALLVAIGTALCFDLARRPHVDRTRKLAITAVTTAIVAGTSMWLGPFVLVPSAASALLILVTSQSLPYERKPMLGLAILAMLGPLAVEWAGLVPRSYEFSPGRLCLLARAFELSPTPTVAMIVWTTLCFALVPAVLLSRMRDQLDQANMRLALQSWQLRQLG